MNYMYKVQDYKKSSLLLYTMYMYVYTQNRLCLLWRVGIHVHVEPHMHGLQTTGYYM